MPDFIDLPNQTANIAGDSAWRAAVTGDTRTASIVHDLRNPLAAICGCAEMLLNANLSSEENMRVVTNIHRAAGRMREMLNEFSCLVRGQADAVRFSNLYELVKASCDSADIAQTNLQVKLDVPGRIEIPAIRSRMERVFLNLILNAREAMPDGGEVRITARELANYVLIEVEDNGPGIPSEILGCLFGHCVTAGKQGGLGLGLMLARQTVRDHGGELWTEPAAGARFLISIPMKRQLADVGKRNLVDISRYSNCS